MYLACNYVYKPVRKTRALRHVYNGPDEAYEVPGSVEDPAEDEPSARLEVVPYEEEDNDSEQAAAARRIPERS